MDGVPQPGDIVRLRPNVHRLVYRLMQPGVDLHVGDMGVVARPAWANHIIVELPTVGQVTFWAEELEVVGHVDSD